MMERLEEFSYTKKDFILDWYSGTGPGGQKRNKTQCCLRLTHIPSDITVQSTRHKERPANLKAAFKSLKPLLEEWIKSQLNSKEYPKSDELVRTYHVVDNRVKDHSSGLETSWKNIDKDFDIHVMERLKAGRSDNSSGR